MVGSIIKDNQTNGDDDDLLINVQHSMLISEKHVSE